MRSVGKGEDNPGVTLKLVVQMVCSNPETEGGFKSYYVSNVYLKPKSILITKRPYKRSPIISINGHLSVHNTKTGRPEDLLMDTKVPIKNLGISQCH